MLLATKAPSPRTPTTSVASKFGLKSDALVPTRTVGPITIEVVCEEVEEEPKVVVVARDAVATPRTADEVAMPPVVEGEV